MLSAWFLTGAVKLLLNEVLAVKVVICAEEYAMFGVWSCID